MKLPCDCGCGGRDYLNRLTTIPVEREGKIRRRYLVLKECEAAFTEELILMHRLNEIVRSASGKSWFTRAFRFRRIMQLQHAIHARTKGEDMARRISLRSSIVFATPVWVGKLAERVFKWQDARNSESES